MHSPFNFTIYLTFIGRCYMRTENSLRSGEILNSWKYSTRGFSMTCSRAHGRVPGRCNDDARKKEACTKACGSASICQKALYLTGKADCKGNTYDSNAWMVPEKFCCSKHPYFTIWVIPHWLVFLCCCCIVVVQQPTTTHSYFLTGSRHSRRLIFGM